MRPSVTAAAVGVEVLMAIAVRRPLDLPVPLRWTGIDPASRVPIQRQDLGVASPRQLHNQRCRQRARQGDLLSPGRRGPCSHDLLHRLAGQRPGRCGCLQHRVHPRGVGLTQPAGPGDNPGYVRTRSATADSRARPSGGRGHWRWSRSSSWPRCSPCATSAGRNDHRHRQYRWVPAISPLPPGMPNRRRPWPRRRYRFPSWVSASSARRGPTAGWCSTSQAAIARLSCSRA